MKTNFSTYLLIIFSILLIGASACTPSQPEEINSHANNNHSDGEDSHGEGTPLTGVPVEIAIEMSEYAFIPSLVELLVGQEVTLIFNNVGMIDHEFMAGLTVTNENGMPNGFEMDFFEMAGVTPVVKTIGSMDDTHSDDMEMDDHDDASSDDHEETGGHADHSGFMVNILPGDDTTSITFVVTEDMIGEWEIGCFLLEGVHHIAGMSGTLIVSP